MEIGCSIEVEVNGEETFIVDKNIFECFFGRFRKLCKSTGRKGRQKLILNDFPGGGDGFELLTSFICNNGDIEITPHGLFLLNSAADFMAIDKSSSLMLVDQTEKFLGGIDHWNWSELLLALKQCQDTWLKNDSSFLIEKTFDSVIEKIVLNIVQSPISCCSSENFSSQLSSDTSSTCSTRNSPLTPIWFEDLAFLKARLFDKLLRVMLLQKLDHFTIFKLLIFYLKSSLGSAAGKPEKRRVINVVISMLSSLEKSSLSCKGLFEILRVVSRVKRKRRGCDLKLERLIGSKLDQATIDHLMISNPLKKGSFYDVNLVLRLAEAYVVECNMSDLDRMKKVRILMDTYLVEVAADLQLKPMKFAALAMILSDSARESNDKLYQAIDLYLQVHTQLCEEEKMRICGALNYDKLSREALNHLARNSKFPSIKSAQDFVDNLRKSQRDYKSILSRKKYVKKNEYMKEIGDVDVQCGKIESESTKMKYVRGSRKCSSAKIRYMPRFC